MKGFTLTLALMLVVLLTSAQAKRARSDSDVYDSDDVKLSPEEDEHLRRRFTKFAFNPDWSEQIDWNEDTGASLPTLSRNKRATCDLLSYFNVNNSVCALHCLAKGFKGGFCDSKSICNCRK